jgi:hypothetical protein
MTKNVVAFVVAVGTLFFSTQLSAQDSPISVGFQAGTNLSSYRLDGAMTSSKSKMGIGGSVGGFFKYDLSQNFALRSGIDVHYRNFETEALTNYPAGKFKSFGIEVPLYGVVQGAIGSGKVFIGAGPYVGYGLGAKSNGVNLFKSSRETGTAAMNRFDYGAGGIIGYDFARNWQINASYRYGMADLLKSKEADMNSQSASIGIAYMF